MSGEQRTSFSVAQFLLCTLLLVAAALLELDAYPLLGWHPSTVLAVLITLAFFLEFLPLLFLALLGVFLLIWQPQLEPELLLLFGIPLVLFLVRKSIPVLEGWFGNVILVALGISGFYVIGEREFLVSLPLLFLDDLFVSVLFGALIFSLLSWLYEEKVTRPA